MLAVDTEGIVHEQLHIYATIWAWNEMGKAIKDNNTALGVE